MENKKIKVLKDTPFDKKDTLLSLDEWRERYSYIVHKQNSDEFLINYLQKGYKNDFFSSLIEGYFEVIENQFKVGDWVYNELMKQALYVVEGNKYGKEWYPCMCTIHAVNENPETYKRLATQEEIDYYTLESFCNRTVLIGKYRCYYFDNVWKPLQGVRYNIEKYLKTYKEFGEVYTSDSTWKCNLNGLKVGCTEISHEDILKIAKILKLI